MGQSTDENQINMVPTDFWNIIPTMGCTVSLENINEVQLFSNLSKIYCPFPLLQSTGHLGA